MSKFKLLTVMENQGQSDRLTIQQELYRPDRQTLRISITNKRNLVVETWTPDIIGSLSTRITTIDIDLNGLIQYLQDAKTWISEEEMIETLVGTK